MPGFDRPPQEGGQQQVVLPEGVYTARAEAIRPGESHENRTPYVGVDFKIYAPDTDFHRHQIDLRLWDTDKAYDFATSRLLELVDKDWDTFIKIIHENQLTASGFDEILYHFRVKNQWYEIHVVHTPRRNDPDRPWANVVKVKQIDPPPEVQQAQPKPQPKPKVEDPLEQPF